MNLRFVRPSRATVLSVGLTAFLIGLFFGRFILVDPLLIAPIGMLTFLFRRHKLVLLALLAGGLFVLGAVRAGNVTDDIGRYDQFIDQKTEVIGRVVNDPKYNSRGQIEFRIGSVQIDGYELPGTMRISTFRAIGLQRGDLITAQGKVRDGFASWQASMSFATVETISRSGNPIESIRRQYFAGVYSSIAEPQASLGLGFLVGLRALLPESLLDQLSATGLTHIVAVSGYNLTVLVGITKRWFARQSRYVALVSSLALMAGFILVTGGAASIVRASVVTVLSVLAWYFGRTIQPIVILLISAALTAGVNPIFIWYDLGWWLSFLAFFGVLIVAPLLQPLVFKREPGLFGRTFLETSSAQLLALPLSVSIFGEVSVVSLLANMLILPLIPLAMLLTAVAGTAGLLVPHIAGWFAWPAGLLLEFITTIIALLAKVPGAVAQVSVSTFEMLSIYALILVWVVILRALQVKRRRDFAILAASTDNTNR